MLWVYTDVFKSEDFQRVHSKCKLTCKMHNPSLISIQMLLSFFKSKVTSVLGEKKFPFKKLTAVAVF